MNFSDIIKTGQQFAQKAAQPKRPAGGVRRRNETRGQFKNRMGGQSDNSDITELFKGIQQTRTRVHKGMDGNPIDPNAPKGLDKLYADNPHLKPSAGLQAQNNWQARDAAGAAAVARKKAEQEAARNPYGNVVTAPNGSRGVTNSMGQIVGTTAPVGDGSKRVFDDATGKMVPMDQWFADRNAVQQSKGMTPSPVAQAWNTAQNTKPDSMDLLFSGKPQSSPPGGAQAGMVGPPAPQGAPGGDMLFGKMPDVQSKGMPLPEQPTVAQAASPYDFPPNAGPQYTPMMPNDGPTQMYPFQYGNMAQPAYGTLAEKETARRNAVRQSGGALKGVFGQAGAEASNMLGAVGNSLKWLFGDPNSQVQNVAPQVFNDNNPAQQLNQLEALLAQQQQTAIQRNQQNPMAQLMDRLNAMMYR